MAAGRWVGRGDKNGADGVAVNAMRVMISTIGMNGTVVIGEGEKDNAPMLYNGEQVGDGTGPSATSRSTRSTAPRLTAKGMSNAVAVLAVAPRGSMYDPSAVFYMEKLVTGPEAADVVDIRYPVAENIHQVAKAKGSSPYDVTVVLLDRPPARQARRGDPRHRRPDQVHRRRRRRRRDHGRPPRHRHRPAARHRRHPEGIIAACAMKCLGGVIQGRLWPQDDDERQKALDAGHDLDPDFVLRTDDLVTGDDCFFVATGITDGELMRGVRYRAGGCTTDSLVMRSRSGTIRSITSEHQLSKLRDFAAIDFEH